MYVHRVFARVARNETFSFVYWHTCAIFPFFPFFIFIRHVRIDSKTTRSTDTNKVGYSKKNKVQLRVRVYLEIPINLTSPMRMRNHTLECQRHVNESVKVWNEEIHQSFDKVRELSSFGIVSQVTWYLYQIRDRGIVLTVRTTIWQVLKALQLPRTLLSSIQPVCFLPLFARDYTYSERNRVTRKANRRKSKLFPWSLRSRESSRALRRFSLPLL